MAQIAGQAINHLRAPSLLLLARQDVAPDLPVKQHKLPVDGQRRPRQPRPDRRCGHIRTELNWLIAAGRA